MTQNQKSGNDPIKSLIESAKTFADKAEDFMEEAADKLQNSETLKKAGKFLEDKVEELEKGDLKAKLQSFADKVEEKAGEIYKEVASRGKKFTRDQPNKSESKD